MITIGSRLEPFFDDYLLDTERTTAASRLHEPRRAGIVLSHDAPWEGDGCNYHNFFRDGDIWRMYYLGWKCYRVENSPYDGIRVCYAESRDGIHWEKPNLGLCEYNGSKENNIILDKSRHGHIDNFYVFKDENPACPPEERYKGIASNEEGRMRELCCWFSEDGIHFNPGVQMFDKGAFDSLNVALWDKVAGIYRCYFRAAHKPGSEELLSFFDETCIRDIRVSESKDFRTWSEPRLLDFGDSEDSALYTNVVSIYPRAPHISVGFPSRYTFRETWNGSFDELAGREERLLRCKIHPRIGQVITDCLFMSSRDGRHFTRSDEAFLRPLPENPLNWVYGDCYPAVGLLETESEIPGADPELSLFLPENHWMNIPAELARYTIRMDGFRSLYAGAKEKRIVTKPFVYDGDTLRINFATSARGYLYLTLVSGDGTRYESCETFGNKIDRRVIFDDPGAVARLSGQPITLEIRIMDADLYAIRFTREG